MARPTDDINKQKKRPAHRTTKPYSEPLNHWTNSYNAHIENNAIDTKHAVGIIRQTVVGRASNRPFRASNRTCCDGVARATYQSSGSKHNTLWGETETTLTLGRKRLDWSIYFWCLLVWNYDARATYHSSGSKHNTLWGKRKRRWEGRGLIDPSVFVAYWNEIMTLETEPPHKTFQAFRSL